MNKKIEAGKRLRLSYNLTPDDMQAFYRYFMGYINSRELSELVGMSHQGALGAAVQISRDWLQKGYLKFTNDFMEILPDVELKPPHPSSDN